MDWKDDLKKFISTYDFGEDKLEHSNIPQNEEHYKMLSERMKGKNNPVHVKGPWNKGLSVLHRGQQPAEERRNTSERIRRNNPNADGKSNAKETIVEMKNGEVYEFETLLIARQQVEEMTGQVQNHSSIWRSMKMNKPYKGNVWRYKNACAI